MGKGHKLAGFSYIYNGVKFDIPFIQSIESVIDVVDEFVLAECYSEDETWELCQQLSFKYPNKIKLVRHAWVKHYSELRNLANWASHQTSADISYIMELQSDECIHEKDLEELSASIWTWLYLILKKQFGRVQFYRGHSRGGVRILLTCSALQKKPECRLMVHSAR